jgi:predicted nucleotidyltransferase
MNDNEKLEKIKEIILDECGKVGVVVDRIILFGSRARGDNRDDSDFDIYVVVDNELEFSDMMNIFLKIKRGLAKLHISNDVIIRSRDIFEKNKTCIGFISYYVNKEGMDIWKRT